MINSVDAVRKAATDEHGAEQNRATAEAAWRRTWWRTSQALARVQDREQRRLTLEEASRVLGVSTSYLSSRRRTAATLAAELDDEVVASLPPRLSIEYARTGQAIDAKAVETLLDAERDEVSVRDFARQLGTQPKSWEREGERAASSAAAPLDPTPQQTRQLLEDPEFVRRFDNARAEREAERTRQNTHDGQPLTPRPRDHEDEEASAEARAHHEMVKARLAIRAAHDALADVAITRDNRPALTQSADLLQEWAALLSQRVAGTSIDEELADLLSREQP